MDLVQLTPDVWQLRFPRVNAYFVRLPRGLVLVDSGPAGSEDDILGAARQLGLALPRSS